MADHIHLTDEIIEQAHKLALLGMTDKQMIAFFEIAEQTWYNWQKASPTFRQRLKDGKALADAKVAQSLYRRACGYSHPDVHIMPRTVTEYNEKGKRVSTKTEPLMIDIVKHYPPDTGAACFWLKNRQRDLWKDAHHHEFEGSLLGIIQDERVNFSDFSTEEVSALLKMGMQKRAIKEAERQKNDSAKETDKSLH